MIIEAGNEIIEEVSLTQKNNGSWSYTSIQLAGGDYSLQLQAYASDPLLELDEFEVANLSFSIEGEPIEREEIATPISDVAQDQDDDRSNAEESVFSKNRWFFSLLTMANAGLIAILLVIYRRYFIVSDTGQTAETNDEGLLDVKNQGEENPAVVSHKDMDTINPSLASELNDIDSDFDISQSDEASEDSDNKSGK